MATAAEPPYAAVKAALARAIRTRRSDCIPAETARQLLAYDASGPVYLVGIDHAGTKAVYYSGRRHEVVFVRFDSSGLADGGAVLGSFEGESGFEAWIQKMDAYWGWLHPRYR